MNLINKISRYQPFNEQEVKDKQMLLEYFTIFEDVLTRNNEIAHFTSSSFIVNKDKSKALLIHHNIFNSWGWTGGHCDGDEDVLNVALKEAREETGLTDFTILDQDIFGIDIVPVLGHFKRGKYVSGHVHLSVVYLLQTDENMQVTIKKDENSGVKWFDLDEVNKVCSEPHMRVIYKKIMDKMKKKFDLK